MRNSSVTVGGPDICDMWIMPEGSTDYLTVGAPSQPKLSFPVPGKSAMIAKLHFLNQIFREVRIRLHPRRGSPQICPSYCDVDGSDLVMH